MHKAPCIQNMLEESKLALEDIELRPTKKANIMPVALVAAMEAEVVDDSQPNFKRGFAWYKLVKLWTGMRYNDTQGVPMRTAELGDFCWKAEIHLCEPRCLLGAATMARDWLADLEEIGCRGRDAGPRFPPSST